MGNIIDFSLAQGRQKTADAVAAKVAACATVTPFLRPARLEIAGRIALRPALEPLKTLANRGEPEQVPPQEQVLNRMLILLREDLSATDRTSVARLAAAPFAEILRTADEQINRTSSGKSLHLRWKQVWRHIGDPTLCEFALRCATILTEAVLLSERPRQYAAI